ncbi:MAG: LolA family protein [Candidatus Binataceae bacterium]
MLSIALAASTCPASAAAQIQTRAAKLDNILHHVERNYQTTNSFSAKFTEQVNSAGGTTRNQRGVVYYRKPGKMRWNFTAPQPETIVSNGATVYSYEPDLNQVIETPLKNLLKSPSATAFLLGMGDLRQNFRASIPAANPDGLIHVLLIPKGGGDKINLGLNRGTYTLASVILTDPMGDVTMIRLSDLKVNPPLNESLFNFKVPAGADIVRTP